MSDDSGFSESQNSSVAAMDSCIWVTVSLLDLQYDLCAAWCTHISCMSKWTPVCFEAPPSSLSLPFHMSLFTFSLYSKLLSTGQHFITDQSTFAFWSSMIPISAFQTAKGRSLCTGRHTVRSPALRKLSAVYWYTLLWAHTHTHTCALKFICRYHLPSPPISSLFLWLFVLLCVCRRQLPLSPCWTGRTMRDGHPCTLPLPTVTRQWWRCWRLMRAVMWQLMITSSERRCTGQLCSVGAHRSCMWLTASWMTTTHWN